MNLKKLLLVVMTTLMLGSIALPSVARADDFVKTDGLSEEQKAQIQLQIAQLKKPKGDAQAVSATTRKEVEAWADMGQNFGAALVACAKELGVAANEFAQTPLGKVAVVLIVYKVMGHDLLGLIYGSIVLVIGWWVALYILRTMRFSRTQPTYGYQPYLFGFWNRRVTVQPTSETEGELCWRLICSFGMFALSTLIGLKIIF